MMKKCRGPFCEKADLYQLYPTVPNPIWLAYQHEFEEMFRYLDTAVDKGWYVSERVDRTTGAIVPEHHTPEAILLGFLHSHAWPEPERLVLVHGGIGHGKTTFLKHFFEAYLADRDAESYKRLIYLYVDCSKAATEPGDFEEDLDHRLSGVLDKCLRRVSGEKNEYEIWSYHPEFPSSCSKEKQDEWIKATTNPQPGRKTSSRYAAWNLARVRYLLRVHGSFLTLIVDNIDQAQAGVQTSALQTARHKVDWWTRSDDPAVALCLKQRIIVIIAVREYIVKRVLRSSPENAFRDRRLRIQPPNIHLVHLNTIKVSKWEGEAPA
ncbi:hypothetical protein FJY63_07985, partial [Candidatus Sumerlaeota bacterium]|nr:hypothetical protein [Candidatus Sumerlaeota bacterium]